MSNHSISEIFERIEADPSYDIDQLVPLLYDELRKMARKHLGHERRNQTLHTTALVHEAYLKLAKNTQVTQKGRAYFFAAAGRAMRQIFGQLSPAKKCIQGGALAKPC